MRRSLAGLAVAATMLLGAASICSDASASGFPDFDPQSETVVFGRVKAGGVAVSATAKTRGTWTLDGGKLLATPPGSGNGVWLPDAARASLRDGTVRVRLEPGKRVDIGILLRLQSAKDTTRLSGYEFSINRTALRFHRWDRGVVLPMGPETKVARIDKRRSLEVVVYAVGPQLIATVYDGDKLTRLATLAIHDTTYGTGRVGLRAGAKHSGGAFTLVSVMDSATVKPKGKVKHGLLYGPKAPAGTTPFGNTRYAFVRADDVDKLPADLKKRVQQRLFTSAGKQAVLFLDTVELERLRRTGIDILRADSNVAWKTFNPAYRVRSGKPPTPTKRGVRIDQSYKDHRLVAAILRAYHERYPDITQLQELGRSHQGRPILALKISDKASTDESEPAVLLNASHHGSELLPVEYNLDVVQKLLEGYGRDRRVTAWVDGLEIYCVPLVNPDGNHMFIEVSRFAGRKNGRDSDYDGNADPFEGVDLNRNYPYQWGQVGSSSRMTSKYYRGIGPGSEPETAAMMSLASKLHFATSISFHTIGTAVFSPYAHPSASNPLPDVALAVAMEMASAAPVQPNKKFYEVRPTGYPVAGSDQDWLLHAHGTLAYIVEGSNHNPNMKVREAAVAATRPVWKALLDRTLKGPRISGHVRDAAGKPLVATVMIEEVETRSGERWKSRRRDGRFDRMVVGPGTYTIKASAKGMQTAHKTVRVKRKPMAVDVVLRPK